MTWGVTFIGQRGQFEIGLKGSLCVGISSYGRCIIDINLYNVIIVRIKCRLVFRH